MGTIELRLLLIEDGHPDRWLARRIDEKDLALAEKVKSGLGVFKSPEIAALNNRRGQNELISHTVASMGSEMADYRDDRDGWNGERRAEIIAALDPRNATP